MMQSLLSIVIPNTLLAAIAFVYALRIDHSKPWLKIALCLYTISAIMILSQVLFNKALHSYLWFPLESSIHCCWLIYLFQLQKLQKQKINPHFPKIVLASWIAIVLLSVLPGFISSPYYAYINNSIIILLLSQLIYATLMLENIARNLLRFAYWHSKPLIQGLFILFIFNLLSYTFALLLKGFYPLLWQLKPVVTLLALLLIIQAHRRDIYQAISLYSSKTPILFSSTLMVICCFFLITALAGQLSLYFSQSADSFLALLFIGIATTSILALFFSTQVRSFIREHVLAQKYDYRSLWQEFNAFLYQKEGTLNNYDRACLAIASLYDVKHAALWVQKTGGEMFCHSNFLTQVTPDSELTERLKQYLKNEPLYLFPANNESAFWLVTALYKDEKLQGMLLMEAPPLSSEFNAEDQQLLKQVCEQASFYLQQHQSDEELSELHLFDTYHQATAYIMHDLKTLKSQFSLLSKNAVKHKYKQGFIDDAIKTIEHADRKIGSLLQRTQLHKDKSNRLLDVKTILNKALSQRQRQNPAPSCLLAEDCFCQGDADDLETVFVNVIKNAQEACNSQDKIEITLCQQLEKITIHIHDSGIGMTEQYMREKLFKPFHSTKGVNGMGIGLYQCQKIIHAMAGTIEVISNKTDGSCFSIFIPAIPKNEIDNQAFSDDEKLTYY
ncbi:MAG: GHKL domain-containing protein [Pseudomonadales bacterium]|nr:GHKL domain-containing protein [Pseudomonadales bacterium]